MTSSRRWLLRLGARRDSEVGGLLRSVMRKELRRGLELLLLLLLMDLLRKMGSSDRVAWLLLLAVRIRSLRMLRMTRMVLKLSRERRRRLLNCRRRPLRMLLLLLRDPSLLLLMLLLLLLLLDRVLLNLLSCELRFGPPYLPTGLNAVLVIGGGEVLLLRGVVALVDGLVRGEGVRVRLGGLGQPNVRL